MAKDPVFQISDIVREAGFALHKYLGPGHLEKVYENGLMNRLRKAVVSVEQQAPLQVYDEDGTRLGNYFADLLVEGQLLVEIKAASAINDAHIAQLLGYLRASKIEHGLLINFGAPKFQIRMLGMSQQDQG